MNNISRLLTTKMTYFIFALCAIFIATLTYLNLDKGFIFNDEAYYLFHYKNKGQMLTLDRTNFFRIFEFLYTPNIHLFRIVSITTLVISNFVMCFAVLKYLEIKGNVFLYSTVGIFIGFHTWSITNLIIQQYIGNTILVNLGIALLLFSKMHKKPWLSVISGFILSFILFNGNSHTVVLLPIFLFFLVTEKTGKLKKVLLFVSGGIFGIAIYFTFLDSIANFKSQLQFLKEYLGFHRKQHSVKFMILWVIYLFLNGIFPVATAYLILWKSKFSLKSLQIFDYILSFLGLTTIITFVFFDQSIFMVVLILFIHLMVLRFCIRKDENINSKYLIVLLLLISYGLTFGSQTWFTIRISAYLVYYVVLMLFLIYKNYSQNWKAGFLFFIIVFAIQFPSLLHSKGWKDFIFTEQSELVQVNGHFLYLDKGRKNDIDALKPYLYRQEKVIYSSNHLLGYLYILDAYPPIPYYFTLKDYLDFIIKKRGDDRDDYIYIESNDYPFSPKEMIPLHFVKHPEKYQTVKTGRFTLYLPANFQKK